MPMADGDCRLSPIDKHNLIPAVVEYNGRVKRKAGRPCDMLSWCYGAMHHNEPCLLCSAQENEPCNHPALSHVLLLCRWVVAASPAAGWGLWVPFCLASRGDWPWDLVRGAGVG